jgi:hypothetical protein
LYSRISSPPTHPEHRSPKLGNLCKIWEDRVKFITTKYIIPKLLADECGCRIAVVE